jgi:hypothetical protein
MSRSQANELIARLLGPAGPEAGCDECFERLDEYVEAQLAERDATALHPRIASHLEGCPACREDAESLRAYLTARGRA